MMENFVGVTCMITNKKERNDLTDFVRVTSCSGGDSNQIISSLQGGSVATESLKIYSE